MTERFIVAEVSKNWVRGKPVWQSKTLSQLFEDIVNKNHQRGYRLNQFSLHRLLGKDEMNETIIAVFERMEP